MTCPTCGACGDPDHCDPCTCGDEEQDEELPPEAYNDWERDG